MIDLEPIKQRAAESAVFGENQSHTDRRELIAEVVRLQKFIDRFLEIADATDPNLENAMLDLVDLADEIRESQFK